LGRTKKNLTPRKSRGLGMGGKEGGIQKKGVNREVEKSVGEKVPNKKGEK